MQSLNYSWEKMCNLEKGEPFVSCVSLPFNHLFLHFICPPILSFIQALNHGWTQPLCPSARPKALLLGSWILCPAPLGYSINPRYTWPHGLDPSNLGCLYLLIITDTVFTLGLKEQRPFPDSHLESILKICSCKVDLCVTSHVRNH